MGHLEGAANVLMDLLQTTWEWYKVCGRVEKVVLVQKRKIGISGNTCGTYLTTLWGLRWDLDVHHVKPHRTNNDKNAMTKEHRFVTKGNEKANEVA